MSDVTPDARVLGDVPDDVGERLRDTMLYASLTFDFYAALFHELGISRSDLKEQPPTALLGRLPLLEGDGLNGLSEESLRAGKHIIDMETSSGTTGPRKRRFITYDDDQSETAFLAELFVVCGIGEEDRVACVDTDPLTLMVSFTKALDLLGVQEAYSFCVGSGFDRALEALPELDPSVIITVPSIMERCLDALSSYYAAKGASSLRKLIYVGEPLPARLRSRLESAFGVEIFGYYGASETSALGIECRAHDGIHLFTNRNVIELVNAAPSESIGEIVVTTLCQRSPPLLRYALKDKAQVRPGVCGCGLPYPRVDVLGRTGDSFSVLGAKISYLPILSAVYAQEGAPGHMQLVLTRQGRDRLTVVLPDVLCGDEARMRQTLLRSQPDLDFLVGGGYLELSYSFVREDYFDVSRKRRRVVDRRD